MAAGSIPIKKVYIDSRLKTKDKQSNSDFKYEFLKKLEYLSSLPSFVKIKFKYFNIILF